MIKNFILKSRKLNRLLRSIEYIRALLFGVAAAIEHEPILRMRSYAMVVDIGANRGQFALAVRHYFPGSRIISFEPLPTPSSTFRRIFRNDKGIILYQVAIAPYEGEEEIHISKRDDSSSLLPITSTQSDLFPGTEESGKAKIYAAPLTKYIKLDEIVSPALLKLDVQGYELEALRGCKELLPRFDSIYVECSFVELYQGQALAHEVIAYLSDSGFLLSGVYNIVYDQDGKAIQGDFLFKSEI